VPDFKWSEAKETSVKLWVMKNVKSAHSLAAGRHNNMNAIRARGLNCLGSVMCLLLALVLCLLCLASSFFNKEGEFDYRKEAA
jgi:hypothetical protein